MDINERFPKECEYVLKTLKKVYKNDAYTKEKADDAAFHNDHVPKVTDADYVPPKIERFESLYGP